MARARRDGDENKACSRRHDAQAHNEPRSHRNAAGRNFRGGRSRLRIFRHPLTRLRFTRQSSYEVEALEKDIFPFENFISQPYVERQQTRKPTDPRQAHKPRPF